MAVNISGALSGANQPDPIINAQDTRNLDPRVKSTFKTADESNDPDILYLEDMKNVIYKDEDGNPQLGKDGKPITMYEKFMETVMQPFIKMTKKAMERPKKAMKEARLSGG